MDRSEDLQKLARLVNQPDWDLLMVYLDGKRVECHEKLEVTDAATLPRLQGQLAVIKDMLTLRKTVNTIMSVR